MSSPDYTTLDMIGTGDPVPSSWFNLARTNLERLIDPPRVKAMRTTDPQAIPTSTWTSVEFEDYDAWDTDGFHTPPDAIITIPDGLDGIYDAKAVAQMDNSPTGNRAMRFLVNSVDVFGASSADAADTLGAKTSLTATEELELNAGDTIEVQIYHQRTVDLDLDFCRFSLRWIARI